MKFLYPLVGLIAGIFIADYFITNISFGLITLGCSLLIWAIIITLSKNPIRGVKLSKWHSLWIFLLFMSIGSIDYDINSRMEVGKEIEQTDCRFTGRIDEIKYLTDGDRFKVHIFTIRDHNGEKINNRNLNILLKTNNYLGRKGDIISFKCVPFKFNDKVYAEKLRHQGINYYSNIKTEEIYKAGQTNSIFNIFLEYRDKIIVKIEKSSLERNTAEFLISILLGDKSLLETDIRQTLTSAGLAHILALSGMHIAIILSFFLAMLIPLSMLGHNNARRIIALILIWIYILFTGAAWSTVRAGLMATMVLTALITERKNSAINALLASGVLILIFDPLALWNIGLQLSFICVLSILLFVDKFNPVERHIHPRLFSVINLVLISLVTTFSTWCLSAYYFGNVPIMFLPANLILLPLLPLFVGGAMVYTVLLTIGIDFHLLAEALNLFFNFFIDASKFFTFPENSNVNINTNLATVIFWILGILALGMALNTPIRKYGRLAGISASLFFLFGISSIFVKYDSESAATIKFVNNFSKIETQYKENGNLVKLNFPRKNIAQSRTKNFNILCVDQKIHPDSLEILKVKNQDKNSFLIIGSQSDYNQIAELIEESNFTKIFIHSGFGKNQKASLLQLIPTYHWDKIYSLREGGSIEFEI